VSIVGGVWCWDVVAVGGDGAGGGWCWLFGHLWLLWWAVVAVGEQWGWALATVHVVMFRCQGYRSCCRVFVVMGSVVVACHFRCVPSSFWSSPILFVWGVGVDLRHHSCRRVFIVIACHFRCVPSLFWLSPILFILPRCLHYPSSFSFVVFHRHCSPSSPLFVLTVLCCVAMLPLGAVIARSSLCSVIARCRLHIIVHCCWAALLLFVVKDEQ
jgi:hypothetical protein